MADGLDLNGVGTLGGLLWVSFDASGSIGGVDFDDEDILEFNSTGPTWTLVYDGSVQHTALAAADVVAVPEPARWLMLIAGIGFLGVLQLRRSHLSG